MLLNYPHKWRYKIFRFSFYFLTKIHFSTKENWKNSFWVLVFEELMELFIYLQFWFIILSGECLFGGILRFWWTEICKMGRRNMLHSCRRWYYCNVILSFFYYFLFVYSFIPLFLYSFIRFFVFSFIRLFVLFVVAICMPFLMWCIEWLTVRAAFRYVTQRPWNRFPLISKTLVLNPVSLWNIFFLFFLSFVVLILFFYYKHNVFRLLHVLLEVVTKW